MNEQVKIAPTMKDDLYTWYSKKANISFFEAKRFIRQLMKETKAYEIFMSEYWDYLGIKPTVVPSEDSIVITALNRF